MCHTLHPASRTTYTSLICLAHCTHYTAHYISHCAHTLHYTLHTTHYTDLAVPTHYTSRHTLHTLTWLVLVFLACVLRRGEPRLDLFEITLCSDGDEAT
jgi:hypothetical protein